jgi:hypothetical protein
MDDCTKVEGERWKDNAAQHDEVFTRLRGVETELAKQGVRVGMWAAIGATVGSGLVGLGIQLALRFMAGGGK